MNKMNNFALKNMTTESSNITSNKFDTDVEDHRKNYITYKSSSAEAKSDERAERKSRPGDSMTGLVPQMKNLRLSPTPGSDDNSELLAGYVKAVIPPSGTAVIQLAAGSRILDVGTIIYTAQRTYDDDGDHGEELESIAANVQEYREIGTIADIFGSVTEPMYCLKLSEEVAKGDCLKMNFEVFYSRDHPCTRYISVKRQANNRYIVTEDGRL